jgi:hypothetical protein
MDESSSGDDQKENRSGGWTPLNVIGGGLKNPNALKVTKEKEESKK